MFNPFSEWTQRDSRLVKILFWCGLALGCGLVPVLTPALGDALWNVLQPGLAQNYAPWQLNLLRWFYTALTAIGIVLGTQVATLGLGLTLYRRV